MDFFARRSSVFLKLLHFLTLIEKHSIIVACVFKIIGQKVIKVLDIIGTILGKAARYSW